MSLMRILGAFLAALLAVGGAAAEELTQARAATCEGAAPTQWYLAEVAPTLPPWQQHPDRLAPATINDHAYQGLIEVRRFEVYSDEALTCWVEYGDKLAALALAEKRFREQLDRSVPDVQAQRYLRMAAQDDCQAWRNEAQPFCAGVPQAISDLALSRRLRDHEYFRLMERARTGGFGPAAWELAGRQLPQLWD